MAELSVRGRAEQPGSAATVLSMRRSGDRGAPAYNTSKHIFYAADRFADVLHQQAVEEANWDEVRDAGGIDLLVALLRLGPCRASTQAAAALTHLAHSSVNRDAIRDAGGIALLVKLLDEPSDSSPAVVAAQPGSSYDWVETATNGAAALRNLTHNNQLNQDAIKEAGGIPPLIKLLSQGPASNAASRAADALGGLARNTHRANQVEIREQQGIEKLVWLLQADPIGEAATKAAGALKHLAFAYSANREHIREVRRAAHDATARRRDARARESSRELARARESARTPTPRHRHSAARPATPPRTPRRCTLASGSPPFPSRADTRTLTLTLARRLRVDDRGRRPHARPRARPRRWAASSRSSTCSTFAATARRT